LLPGYAPLSHGTFPASENLPLAPGDDGQRNDAILVISDVALTPLSQLSAEEIEKLMAL